MTSPPTADRSSSLRGAGAAPLDVGAALRRAFALWWGALPAAAPAFSATALLFTGVEALGDCWALTGLDRSQLAAPVQLTAGLAAGVAVARLYLARARGQRVDLRRALAFALSRWPAAAAAGVFSSLMVGLGLLLLGFPGILVALHFCLATPLLAATRLDANQVLRRSRAMAFGARFRLALALATAGAPSAVLWALSSLLPEPSPLATRFGLELASASLEGLFAAAQIACFVQLLEDPNRARLAGRLAE